VAEQLHHRLDAGAFLGHLGAEGVPEAMCV
jgi:hypothetical protein